MVPYLHVMTFTLRHIMIILRILKHKKWLSGKRKVWLSSKSHKKGLEVQHTCHEDGKYGANSSLPEA